MSTEGSAEGAAEHPAGRAFRLEELARHSGCELRGDGAIPIRAVRALEQAGQGDLSLLTQARYRQAAMESAASAFLVPPALADAVAPQRPVLVAESTPHALAQILELIYPHRSWPAGQHSTALVEEGAEVDASAHLGPYAVVGARSRIGPGTAVLAHAVVGSDCQVGAGVVMHPHSVLYDGTEVGDGCILHAGVVLGADGFGYASGRDGHRKVPQVGRTVLEAAVEVGANSTVDRAALEETRVGAGTKIDNLVQVGHNVRLGQSCILCGQAGVAGSAQLGSFVVVGGQSGVSGHLELGDGVQVAAKSAALQDVPAGQQVAGIPAQPLSQWRRQSAALGRLGQLLRRVRVLEKRFGSRSDS